jgi:hypothetical protein
MVSVPTDLESVSQFLGVDEIVEKPMEAWGYVERTAGRLTICLRSGVAEARRRFSLAHELGHVIIERFRDPSCTLEYKRFRLHANVADRMSEEQMADHLAGCLLLPSWHMRPFLADRIDIRNVNRAALTAKASLAAGLFRTVWISTEPCTAFLLRSIENGPARLMWVTTSTSVSIKSVRRDLSDPYLVNALLREGTAEAPGLEFDWLECQRLSKDHAGIMNIYCLARLQRPDRPNRLPFNIEERVSERRLP